MLQALTYLVLGVWFWKSPVAAIPKELVQPIGKSFTLFTSHFILLLVWFFVFSIQSVPDLPLVGTYIIISRGIKMAFHKFSSCIYF